LILFDFSILSVFRAGQSFPQTGNSTWQWCYVFNLSYPAWKPSVLKQTD